MERGIICNLCRQRFSLTTHAAAAATFLCPICKATNNQNPNGGETPWNNKTNINGMKLSFGLRSKTDQRDHRRSSELGSLNTEPSPLERRFRRNGQRKRAVVCGVSYKDWKYKLKGTVNDAKSMRNLLVTRFRFSEENVLVLTEEEPKAEHKPTRRNIERALRWLVEDCRNGDSLVFYFSGHGLRQPDFEDDEIDGFDETICPVDFLKEGMILDNQINATIVRPLKRGVVLHAIVDACHSGTILDLEYVYARNGVKDGGWRVNKPPSNAPKGTSGGWAISISACEDDQIAADTSAFSARQMSGALTFLLVELLKSEVRITYGDFLDDMHARIEDANSQGCFGHSMILRKLCGDTLTQKPLLSSSKEFDVYKEYIRL